MGEGGNGTNGNGKAWLRKPQFSIEDVIKAGPWLLALAGLVALFKDVPKDVSSMKGSMTAIQQDVGALKRSADTVRVQLRAVATKTQVQSAINQGNEIHADQYHRIVSLERRAGVRPAPVHGEVRVFRFPRREEWPSPTSDLWGRDPDGDEEQP